jgi:TonB-dependent receptor
LDLNDQQVARLGIYRSLVRPGFQESNAGAVIDIQDNEIEGGNTDLDPTTAWNFDLSWEYYIGAETFVGAGLFFKRIEDSIVEVEARNAVLRGQTWDQASTFFNADTSNILGVEFSYQTAFENGFLFVFNYTHADGETDLPADSVSGQRTVPYFKQAKDTANIAFGYDKDKWDIRLAANYRGKYLDELGSDALSDRYTSDFMQMDLTVKYQFSEQLLITGSALNLNDRPEFYYFGNSNRLSQYDEYGTTYGLGMRFQF